MLISSVSSSNCSHVDPAVHEDNEHMLTGCVVTQQLERVKLLQAQVFSSHVYFMLCMTYFCNFDQTPVSLHKVMRGRSQCQLILGASLWDTI